jgi:hypothetical protein
VLLSGPIIVRVELRWAKLLCLAEVKADEQFNILHEAVFETPNFELGLKSR